MSSIYGLLILLVIAHCFDPMRRIYIQFLLTALQWFLPNDNLGLRKTNRIVCVNIVSTHYHMLVRLCELEPLAPSFYIANGKYVVFPHICSKHRL